MKPRTRLLAVVASIGGVLAAPVTALVTHFSSSSAPPQREARAHTLVHETDSRSLLYEDNNLVEDGPAGQFAEVVPGVPDSLEVGHLDATDHNVWVHFAPPGAPGPDSIQDAKVAAVNYNGKTPVKMAAAEHPNSFFHSATITNLPQLLAEARADGTILTIGFRSDRSQAHLFAAIGQTPDGNLDPVDVTASVNEAIRNNQAPMGIQDAFNVDPGGNVTPNSVVFSTGAQGTSRAGQDR